MKSQRRFAPTGGEFAPESVASFIGIRISGLKGNLFNKSSKLTLIPY